MVGHYHPGQAVAVLHQHLRLLFPIDGQQFRRPVKIALAVGRSELDLPVRVHVSRRNPHRRMRLENKVVLSIYIVGTSRYVVPRGITM